MQQYKLKMHTPSDNSMKVLCIQPYPFKYDHQSFFTKKLVNRHHRAKYKNFKTNMLYLKSYSFVVACNCDNQINSRTDYHAKTQYT